jgi:hypothetical protein
MGIELVAIAAGFDRTNAYGLGKCRSAKLGRATILADAPTGK